MYKIIGGDKLEYGPASLQQLAEWIAQGRVNGQTLVRAEGGADWQPLSTVPELAVFLPPPPLAGTSAGPAPDLGLDDWRAAILARDYSISIGDCIEQGWRVVKNNFGLTVGASLILIVFQTAVVFLDRWPRFGPPLAIAGAIFAVVLQAGLCRLFLRLIRGEQAGLGDLFSGFGPPLLPLLIIGMIMSIPGTFFAVAGRMIGPLTPENLIGRAGGFIVVGVVLLPLAIYLGVAWAFSTLLAIERPLGAWSALELSRKAVSKHWIQVFGLFLVSGIVVVSGLFACCLGLFITFPIGMGAFVTAYEHIFGVQTKSET